MSVWVVASAHVDVLVLAGVQLGVPYDAENSSPPGALGLAAAGQDLWAENHRSADHRYGSSTTPPAYPAPVAEILLDRIAVVKAIDCYVYQSCEHPGWFASRAENYCRRLRAAAMDGLPLLPGGGRYPVGWDDAPWGIDHLVQAAARVSLATGCDGRRRPDEPRRVD